MDEMLADRRKFIAERRAMRVKKLLKGKPLRKCRGKTSNRDGD
jgi:hypothetical protein